MFRRFNDLSIRGKLIVIVAGAVAVLTTGVLISVELSARRQVDADVNHELQAARTEFNMSEGEHLHEHVLEAEAIADSDELQEFARKGDRQAACAWAAKTAVARGIPVNPEDAFDLAAIVLPNGALLAVARNGKPPCGARELKWRFPGVVNENRMGEITNWESSDGEFYELIESPITNDAGRDLGTLVIGFDISDTFAAHIKRHTGQDVLIWHVDEDHTHLLGASNPSLKKLLASTVSDGGLVSEIPLTEGKSRYSVLNATFEDHSDIVRNPQGLHVALVQSLDEKYQPFRQLQFTLLYLAFAALILGLIVGMFLSGPIATPLINLADAADKVANGELTVAEDWLQRHPERVRAKDEIGVLGRSFLRMVQGLKERLAMSTFLSQATREHIQRNTKDDFISERTSLVILFSDVRQFSNFSETRDPEAVIQLLNQVLSIEAEIVKKRGGDIDKFVGDALVAWFSGEDRCLRAVQAANEMINTLVARFGGQPGTRIGVGIHVGEVVVGSVGSSARKDYTAIGSVVNMAARLCSSAQAGQVLVSEAVKAELKGEVNLKPLAPVSLKGFSEPVSVFEATLAEGAGA